MKSKKLEVRLAEITELHPGEFASEDECTFCDNEAELVVESKISHASLYLCNACLKEILKIEPITDDRFEYLWEIVKADKSSVVVGYYSNKESLLKAFQSFYNNSVISEGELKIRKIQESRRLKK